MSTARNLAALLDSSGDVVAGALDNAGGGGGGGWEEITTGTISSNVEFLEFTGISTDYNSIRLYFTEIQTSAAPNYQAIWVSSDDSLTSPLAWKQYTYGNEATNSTCVSGYGNPTTGKIYLTAGGYSATSTTSDYQQFTMMIEIHDLQDIPYMTVETFAPIGNVGKMGYSMAHGCADRIQSIRIGSAYSSRHYSAGTYKLYGMK